MSLVDVFGKEDRTEVKFSEFFALVKQAAQYETLNADSNARSGARSGKGKSLFTVV